MAKKKKRKRRKPSTNDLVDDSQAPDSQSSDSQSLESGSTEPKLDETLRMDTVKMDGDPNATVSMDANATVPLDSNGTPSADPNATVPVDPSATVPVDPSATVPVDPSATVEFDDTTVRIDPNATVAFDADKTVDIDPNQTAAVDENQQTIVDQPSDQTVQIDQETSSHSGNVSIYRGQDSRSLKSSPGPIDDRVSEETTVNIDPDAAHKTADGDFSLMTSGQIEQTVNPRELSDRDMSDWNSAVGQSDQPSGTDSGVIEDSYAEQQFEKLRRVDVANLKSDPDQLFDYRLVRKLGQGGMGDVFVARQGSLDRLLALKLIKPLSGKKRDQLEKTGRLDSVEEERRQQFLSEAIVTGDLDHPNIVPIHDVGLTSDNQLFYAMKRVVGTPWSDVIKEKSRDENLEILIKAADAIGFAHTRGVVHRDIKPENIMLGDFGVVMVMDWGLALLTAGYDKQDSITTTSGLGGTPAFMAPEMATGPIDKIDKASDIYLLGATLFMIITGKPPHHAKNVTECLQAVRSNKIREVPEHLHDELLDVALKAMSSNPVDRYENVESFQRAIREYRSHAESVLLFTRAIDDLKQGKQNQSYADLSRAAYRFEESIKFWEQNEKARQGLAETKIAHATAAYNNGDYDLGLSLLDENNTGHGPLIEKLQAGIRERDSRASRLAVLRKVAVAMLAIIILGGSIAMYTINREKQLTEDALANEVTAKEEAVAAKEEAVAAEEQALAAKEQALAAKEEAVAAKEEAVAANTKAVAARKEAEEAYLVAEGDRALAELNEERAKVQKAEADKQKAKAEKQTEIAIAAQHAAEESRQIAEYDEYVSKIGLAKARLERNEVDGAREILTQLKETSPAIADSWEWRWLWRQANQSQSAQQTDGAIIDLSISESGRTGVVALSNRQVKRFQINAAGKVSPAQPLTADLPHDARFTAVAISADERRIALGTAVGQIVLIGQNSQQTLNGHQGLISDLQFSSDGLLVSGSHDRTVRVWDAEDGVQLTNEKACWHLSPVQQIAVTGSSDSLTLAVAAAKDFSGRIELWQLRRTSNAVAIKSMGSFDQHAARPTSVAITDDGRRVASGDADGNVIVWNASDAVVTDYSKSLRGAIAAISDRSITVEPDAEELPMAADFVRLIDRDSGDSKRLVSTSPADQQQPAAHADQIRSLRFNSQGNLLLSASDDYTLKLWNLNSREVDKRLKGHGGWVIGAEFLAGAHDTVISASNDGTVRSWEPTTYVGSFVKNQTTDAGQPKRSKDAHRDEIWSAEMSPDGSHIVTASRDHTARVMRIDPQTLTFTEVTRLEDELLQEGSEFVAMSFQLDEKHQRLYIGSADSNVQIWDLARGVEIGVAPGTGLNTSLAVSDDGMLMLTGSSSPNVKAILWQLDPVGNASPRVLHRVQGHDQAVTAFAIASNSKSFFTGDRDGRGILWDVDSGQPIGNPLDNLRGYRINAAQFSSTGNELLIVADDEQLTRIDLATRRITARMNHNGVVTQLSMADDGRHAVTISELATIDGSAREAKLWNLESERATTLAQTTVSRKTAGKRANLPQIASARIDATGGMVSVSFAATTRLPSSVRIWQLDSVQQRPDKLVSTLPDGPSPSEVGSPLIFRLPAVLGTAHIALPIKNQMMLTMNKNGVFRWNLINKRLVKSYRPHAALTEASFSFDGKRIVTGSRSVKIWDAVTGNAIGKIDSPHVGPVRTVQFAPRSAGDTNYLFATGGDDQVVRVWSWDDQANTVKQQLEFKVDAVVRRIRFAPDAKALLIVGDQGLVQVQSLDDDVQPILFDSAKAGDISSCAFSADGEVVAVGGSDYLVRLWIVPQPGEQAGEPVVLSGHADVINDLTLIGASLKDLRVLTASADDTARLWDPRFNSKSGLGREMLSLRRHQGDVMAVDATENGNLVMTAGRDGMVILWPAE